MNALQPSSRSTHRRTVYLVIAEARGDQYYVQVMSGFSKTPGTIRDLLGLVQNARAAPGAPEPLRLDGSTSALSPPASFMCFDWDIEPLDISAGIVEVPRPGVIMAFHGSQLSLEVANLMAIHLRGQLQRNADCGRFLSSPEASFNPQKHFDIDVFVGYASNDSALALELSRDLQLAGAKLFLAERSLEAGERWEPAIRSALQAAKVVVLLITPNSVSRPWLIFEAGAAWVLGTPIAAAIQYVPADRLPAALPSYQASAFETKEQREAFVLSVLKIVRGADA